MGYRITCDHGLGLLASLLLRSKLDEKMESCSPECRDGPGVR